MTGALHCVKYPMGWWRRSALQFTGGIHLICAYSVATFPFPLESDGNRIALECPHHQNRDTLAVSKVSQVVENTLNIPRRHTGVLIWIAYNTLVDHHWPLGVRACDQLQKCNRSIPTNVSCFTISKWYSADFEYRINIEMVSLSDGQWFPTEIRGGDLWV